MLQKYYTNTIQGKFIKELLRSTYIPTVPIYKLGDSLIQGMTYISGGYIVKAKKNTTDINFPTSLTDSNYFEILEPYVLGKQYRGITSNFVSNSSTYDSETHKQLGNYLRAIRDLYNINLMPFYNCFSGNYNDNIRIDTEHKQIKYSQQIVRDGYKVMLVPIKFNQTYTIYLNSSLPIILGSIYYDDKYVLNETQLLDNDLIQPTYASMDQPIYYRINKVGSTESNNDPNADIINNYLTLLIQVPSAYSSNVVVLEGEYKPLSYVDIKVIKDEFDNEKIQPNTVTEKLCETIVDFTNENSWTNQNIERLFPIEPFLTHTIGTQNYAFSSRLVEYLLQNVITDVDFISDNIERVQQYCSSDKSAELNGIKYTEGYIKGVWDIHLQKYIYDLVTNKFKKPYIFDVNGFVDKDSEQIVNRGKINGGNEKWQN